MSLGQKGHFNEGSKMRVKQGRGSVTGKLQSAWLSEGGSNAVLEA